MNLLLISGCVLIIISIAIGWLIIARKYLSLKMFERLIRDDKNLVKAHIDYVMMALILFSFFFIGVNLPLPLIILACAGAVSDPTLFIFLSIKPNINKKIGGPFSAISTVIFLITTFGIGGSAFFIIWKLIK
ncbi:MAG: hypothetical protein JW976_03520 [Syntrophaceae bacterium]|nr:hypothetical protein [Syntrophaceae bacterium]